MRRLENKRKIVHVTFDMRIGGAEQVICNLMENTDPLKFNVSILCIENFLGPFGKILLDKGYEITCLDRQPGFDTSLIKRIKDHIVNHEIDILHCHQYTPYVYGVLGALFTNCKVIFTEHGRFYPDQKKIKRVLINPILNLFTKHVTAISHATKKALKEFEHFPMHKIQVIYNGIDPTKFYQTYPVSKKSLLNLKNNPHIIGTVARLDQIKNQAMMVKALKIIHKTIPDTFLLFVGDGSEREILESLARQLGVLSHVVFAGFRQDTYFYYQIMDVFLLTSFSEGTAMTLLEAMASGIPCIATNVGGNPEIVKDKETGFIIPSNDHHQLAKNICKILKDETLRKGIGLNARNRFEKEYAVNKMIRSYEALYI